MDLKFISEFSGQAFCFHPKNLSLFTLCTQLKGFIISEIDIYTKAICRTYSIPELHPDSSYASKTTARFEKYLLVFLEYQSQLVLVYPFGYLAFFDYESSTLLQVVQMRGRHQHSIETFCILPKPDRITIFYGAENLKPIYVIEVKNIHGKIVQESKKRIIKPASITILQLGAHPKEFIFYGACSDGCVHVWDYRQDKEIEMLVPSKCSPSKTHIGSSLSVDTKTEKIIYGNANGFISIWSLASLSEGHTEELVMKQPYGVQAVSWLEILRSDKYQHLVATFSNGSLIIFKYIYAEGKTKSRIEELCTLFQGEENNLIPFKVDRTGFILTHPVLPFIVSTWLKTKDSPLLKSTIFLIYHTSSQGTEIAVLLSYIP